MNPPPDPSIPVDEGISALAGDAFLAGPDPVLVLGADDVILACNPAFARLVGSEVPRLAGRSFSEVRAQESEVAWQRAVAEADRGQVVRPALDLRLAGGALLPVDVGLTSVRGPGGGVRRRIATLRERAVGTRLSPSEGDVLLEVMGRTAQIGGWEFDPATRQGRWTEEMHRIYDLKDPPTVDASLAHFAGESRARAERALAGVMRGEPYDLELEFVSARGRRKWVRAIGRPVLENGVVVKVHGSLQDITARREVAAALREQEERLRLFIQHAPVALAMFDRQMCYLEVSQRWLLDYGLTTRAVRGLCHYAVFHDTSEEWKHIHQRGLAGEVVRVEEDRLVRPDGSFQWLHWEVRPWRDAAGVIGGIVIFSEDITERKRVSEALAESEARYRGLVEASFDWVWEIDTSGRYVFASPQIEEMLGYKPAEIVGRTPFDFMLPSEAERVGRAFAQAAADRRPIERLENTILHRDGRPVVVETNGVPVFAADGTWLGYRGMDRDVTSRREAEHALRLQGAALEAAANAIVITDRTGAIEWANRAFSELSGWSLPELRGRGLFSFAVIDRHDEVFFQRMWAAILAGEVWRGEIVNRRKDGTTGTEDTTITPLRDDAGMVTRFIIIKQDVTARKALEAQSRQAQRMEAIGTLAGGIAHDLNNILSPMLMISGMMGDRAASDEEREMLHMMQQGAQRGAAIIRQLLTFSRGLEGERVAVESRHILKEIMAMMRETFPRSIQLSLDVAAEIPAIMVDPTQLHQVVLNLCVNARDAMPDGGQLALSARARHFGPEDPARPSGASPGTYVVIAVRDSGHGIPAEIQHRIFDPFFTTKPVGKGTGLGLSTALGIVRSHGGLLRVDSAPGRGTLFEAYFPAMESDARPVEPSATPAPIPRGEGRLVLLVDDEPDIRDTHGHVLERQGYRVIQAAHGQEGLEQFRRHRGEIAVVLTDLMMPVMGGLAFIRALRELDSKLPVVAISGLGDVDHSQQLADLGVGTFLMKPCSIENLLRGIGKQLPAPA